MRVTIFNVVRLILVLIILNEHITAFHLSNIDKYLIRPRSYLHSKEKSITYDTVNSVEDIKDVINEYLMYRSEQNLPPLQPVKVEKSVLEMFRPSGWYRDLAAEDLASRSNKNLPTALHPLSYVDLERHGYGYLIEGIMKLGGPIEVGKMVGIEWQEPIRPKIDWNSPLAPKREKFVPLDIRGSLSLGGSFEERLAQASDMNMRAVKEGITKKESNEQRERIEGEEGVDYATYRRDEVRRARYKWKEEKVPEGERFSLTSAQRAYLLLVCASTALAHGHATADMLQRQVLGGAGGGVVGVSEVVSTFLLTSSVLSAVAGGTLSQKKARNPAVWAGKGLLGGPLSVLALDTLPSLEVNEIEK
mmetsp:Transcript_5280/g.5421  ORF Transcript_5280/g.5421 Transcript_5280/m.5421 type:complete len:361 (-) Transcript_5280:127-1209(-)